MWFLSRFHRRKPGRTLPRVGRFVPRLELLEDRTVLSTLTVLNTLDSGAGSLRDTIKHAHSGDTIVFAASLDGQTITLTSDQITINKSLDIEGPGASLLTISGNDANRVFDISGGLAVRIDGLTITHGLGNGDVQGANSAALAQSGGAYFASGGVVCLDTATLAALVGNHASTSDDDLFGVFSICS